MKLNHWIAAAVLGFGLASAAAAQPRSIDGPGTLSHRAAEAHFPQRIGAFERSDVIQYDESGRDISASYILDRGEDHLLITVYVYPAPGVVAGPGGGRSADVARADLCRQMMVQVGQVIEYQHRGARRIEDGVAPAVEGLGPGLNLRTVHSYADPSNGQEQAVRSETDLYCYVGGDWLVKYRASSNARFDATDAIETFIRTGPWPGRNPPPDPDETVMRSAPLRQAVALAERR
jgi:hypothetical protein